MRVWTSRTARVAVPVLALVVAASSAGPGTARASTGAAGDDQASAQQQGGADPLAHMLPVRMKVEGVDEAEARRRFAVEADAGELQQLAAERHPDAFAGLWVDSEPRYQVVLAFTDRAAERTAELAREFEHPADLVPATAALSERELTAGLDRLTRDLSDEREGRRTGLPEEVARQAAQAAGKVDLRGNRLVLTLPRAARASERALTARYGTPVVADAGGTAAACSILDCGRVMFSGLQLELPGVDRVCSSAFTVRRSDGVVGALSAAHCTNDHGGYVYRTHAGTGFGNVSTRTQSGSVDAEFIPDQGGFTNVSKYFRTGFDPQLVQGMTPYSSQCVGCWVGKTGRRTGTTIGRITSRDVRPSYVPGAIRFLSADSCLGGGDSGGGTWSGDRALGVGSGYFRNTACLNRNGDLVTASETGDMIYGSLDFALQATGTSLVTGVNAPPTASFTEACDLFLTCQFDGTRSRDIDGSFQYSWNFGDGTGSTSASPRKTWLLPGYYTVRLTVTDNDGASDTLSKQLFVAEE